MAIAPSKLGRLVERHWTWDQAQTDVATLRALRDAKLVQDDIADAVVLNAFAYARDEHRALAPYGRMENDPEERVRVFLGPCLSEKGRVWAVPFDSLKLDD